MAEEQEGEQKMHRSVKRKETELKINLMEEKCMKYLKPKARPDLIRVYKIKSHTQRKSTNA